MLCFNTHGKNLHASDELQGLTSHILLWAVHFKEYAVAESIAGLLKLEKTEYQDCSVFPRCKPPGSEFDLNSSKAGLGSRSEVVFR